MTLEERVKNVRETLERESAAWGRAPRLIAVTKYSTVDEILPLKDLGVTDIGENRVQAIREKLPGLGGQFSVHLIGQLQSNKVKYIIRDVCMIHSLDHESLAREIDRQAQKANLRMPVLIQVNIAKEPQKGGIDEENDEICDEGSLNGTEGHCNESCDGFVCPEGYEWNGEECEGSEQELPECSPTSGTPCYDPESEITWSAKSADQMTWDDAVSYCENLEEYGYDDWRMPNIDELRTVVRNCEGSQTGGACQVSDPDHLSSSDWSGSCACDYIENNNGYYSKLGDDDSVYLWSSSTISDDTDLAWCVNFENGYVNGYGKSDNSYVRCVRSDYEPQTDPCEPNPCFGIENSNYECMSEGDIYMCGCEDGYEWNEEECAPMTVQTECTDLPDNAEWNFSGVVLQTWNGEDWEPEAIAYYSEDAGTYEDCSFKCAQGYVWNEEECIEPAPQQLPECSPTSGTPCMDYESTLTWSAKSADQMNWESAGSYCENLSPTEYSGSFFL